MQIPTNQIINQILSIIQTKYFMSLNLKFEKLLQLFTLDVS